MQAQPESKATIEAASRPLAAGYHGGLIALVLDALGS